MQSRAWCKKGEKDSTWLTEVNTPFSVFVLERNTTLLDFFLSSIMEERGERMERDKKENGEEISNTAKYTSEIFHLGNKGISQ